ncbi:uncharacterized protein LOC126889917 [Diabrotica virgifera virgifera]|uniref:Uncharacterized protein n=1 Tax=Diabrotica virgifera virgifera TaxID=50390 RepID=A0ABM5KWN9_DIAVI|nr:uncharacterized protein LOC126889917 [Diabrotica virgifera virgifera]
MEEEESDSSGDNYIPIPSKQPWQMRIQLKNTALASDRFGVSDRATAAIASSVMHDVGLATKEDDSLIIDKNKVRREKNLCRSNLQDTIKKEPNLIQGLYFDGRKDKTLKIDEVNNKCFRRSAKEEHFSIIKEPGSIYVGHVTPSTGTSKDIASAILDYLNESNFSLDELDVIGCDGTVTNTGWKTGVIRTIAEKIKRPLQWVVCLLHLNELPFRHLFQTLDGETTGPKSFSGPIGSQLRNCEKLPVVKFQIIDCEIPDIDSKILSKDQQYLLDVSLAIKSGTCTIDFAIREPGPISHSRWLTTANRVLRLYMSVESPSEEHLILVQFILKSYMPVWFKIKKKNLIKVVDPVIERNAFFAHPENLLLSMIVDESAHIRELRLRRIIKSRTVASNKKLVRTFKPPKLNFQENEYYEIIDWTTTAISPPPLLRRVSDEEMWAKISTANTPEEWNFHKFPCHTQAVERCVKLVTEASSKLVGAKNRDGFIRTTLLSRASMLSFSSKQDFKVPNI